MSADKRNRADKRYLADKRNQSAFLKYFDFTNYFQLIVIPEFQAGNVCVKIITEYLFFSRNPKEKESNVICSIKDD